MKGMLDIDAIVESDTLTFNGVQFASRPAALRQLLVAQEVIEHVSSGATEGRAPIGIDVGSKYDDLHHILSSFSLRCLRLDVVTRDVSRAFVAGRGERMPFRDGAVDFVVLSHVLAHVENIEPVLAEVRRVLAPSGVIVCLQSNRFGWWKYWGYYIRRNDRAVHYRTYDVWNMRAMFARHGLQIRKMYAPYHFYLHAKYSHAFWRLDRRLLGRVPLPFATQWVAVIGHAREGESVRLPPALPVLRAIMSAVTIVHAVALKSIELLIRGLRRTSGDSEST